MDFHLKNTFKHDSITIDNYLVKIGTEQITNQIIEGLSASPKRISSMFFYDGLGSKLFEEITQLPEYYPTRTEKKILQQVAAEIGPTLTNTNIIELGSGDSSKITILLEAIPKDIIRTIHYTPVDVSQPAIEEAAKNLLQLFPEISIHGIIADFNHQLELIPKKESHLFCFFGGTLGNFTSQKAKDFFKEVSNNMHRGDRFLLGIDLVKDIAIIEKAYNDSKQVTAKFNKNILPVINSLIATDFDPDNFDHLAFYNRDEARIEMHLVANKQLTITSPHFSQPLQFELGERIHTENSHKFTLEKIKDMAQASGLDILKTSSDDKNWFSLITMIKK